MSEEFLGGAVTLHNGDSRDVLKLLPDNSVDSVVTDPPYALVSIVKRFGADGAAATRDGDVYSRSSAGFMGQKWDTGETAFAVEFWAEVMRVLKPGGHVIAFGGTRTYHRLACAVEDAGFEIRDMVQWLYGSGFPKSHDVSKGIAKARHRRDEVLRATTWMAERRDATGLTNSEIDAMAGTNGMAGHWTTQGDQAAIPTAEQWAKLEPTLGPAPEWLGVMHKPAREAGDAWLDAEVVGLKRGAASSNTASLGKFESEYEDRSLGGEAAQWEGWGTALKPACEPCVLARKPLGEGTVARNVLAHGTGALNVDACRAEAEKPTGWGGGAAGGETWNDGNCGLAKDGEPRPVDGRWPANVVHDGSEEVVAGFPETTGQIGGGASGVSRPGIKDSGSAARFFYSAKADALDRAASKHPTVKPVDLMQWMVRLVTPPGGVVLDPFAGSGTTGEAAFLEGFKAILIEREATYCEDIRARMAMADGGEKSRRRAIAKRKAEDASPGGLFG